LPTGTSDLETAYSVGDYTSVSAKDNNSVEQAAASEYAIHQFKDYIGASNSCAIEWYGQTSLAPTSSEVFLEIYNKDTTTWDQIDSNDTAEATTNFTLGARILDLTHYKDAGSVICCRVYQLAK